MGLYSYYNGMVYSNATEDESILVVLRSVTGVAVLLNIDCWHVLLL